MVDILKAAGDALHLCLVREVTRLVPAAARPETPPTPPAAERQPVDAVNAHVARHRQETQQRLQRELERRRAELRPPTVPSSTPAAATAPARQSPTATVSDTTEIIEAQPMLIRHWLPGLSRTPLTGGGNIVSPSISPQLSNGCSATRDTAFESSVLVAPSAHVLFRNCSIDKDPNIRNCSMLKDPCMP